MKAHAQARRQGHMSKSAHLATRDKRSTGLSVADSGVAAGVEQSGLPAVAQLFNNRLTAFTVFISAEQRMRCAFS